MCVGEAANVCGEEIPEKGRRNRFSVAVVQKQERDREMHSVFFGLWHPPVPEPAFSGLHPRVVHRTPAVRAVVWF